MSHESLTKNEYSCPNFEVQEIMEVTKQLMVTLQSEWSEPITPLELLNFVCACVQTDITP